MALSMTPEELAAVRMVRSGLGPERATSVLGAVEQVFALQAQLPLAARLAVRARTEALVEADVQRAIAAERSVVRTWAMRGTLQMVPSAEVGWLVGLLGESETRRGRRRRLQLGLDDDTVAAALDALREVLAAGRVCSRAELIEGLRRLGVDIDATGQAPHHLVKVAATEGLLCRGPERAGDETTVVLIEDWLGRALGPPTDNAPSTLLARYLRGHGPASIDDFQAWTGLPKKAARATAVQREELAEYPDLVEVRVGEQSLLDLEAECREAWAGCARLVGTFDALLLGVVERSVLVDAKHAKAVYPGGGMILSAMVLDGRVVGNWSMARLKRKQPAVRLELRPFARLSASSKAAFAVDASDVARFLGAELELTWV